MRIGFIGAGKVGSAFGRYLNQQGVAIGGYFDHTPTKANHAAQMTNSTACSKAVQVPSCSDIILITTQDDQITAACKSLCRDGNITSRHLVGHMSGTHASTILNAAQANGATIFSIHPLQAFADEERALEELPGTFFSLEGQGKNLQKIESIFIKTGNPYFVIRSKHKKLYHLSACVFSNYLVTLVEFGLLALENSGLDPRQGFKAMRPLLEGTLENINKMGTARALTGPIARGDSGTIAGHIKALDSENLTELSNFYKFMGRLTLKLADKNNLQSDNKIATMRRLLE